ncbi:MAG TPA: CbiX/SirB N-terminal domain-containing protein [Chthoniobacteraceae bacterium]|nr:CbiX/SirB N-terminal domain-containing protein [Chthoniobacteraceae bacterium]
MARRVLQWRVAAKGFAFSAAEIRPPVAMRGCTPGKVRPSFCDARCYVFRQMLSKPHSALIVVGHGSTVNPDSSAPTLAHVDSLSRRGVFGEVQPAFWKEEPSLRQVLHMIDSDDVYVVPNFISEGYFTRTVIPRELALEGALTQRDGRTIKYCEPVGNDPRMTDLLLRRAAEVAPGVRPEETALFIVAHGTDLNDNSATAAKREVARIRETGRYAAVFNAYMDEEPLISRWDEIASQPHVIVVPFFIADGLHSYQEIPVLLGIQDEPGEAASDSEVFRRNPFRIRGRTLFYARAIGTEALFADLILDQVRNFDEKHAGMAV